MKISPQELAERRRARAWEHAFYGLCLSAILLPLMILGVLVGRVAVQGFGRLNLAFLEGYPSRHPLEAGLLPALVGSFGLMILTALFAMPIGVGAAVYLEEYAREGHSRGSARLARLLETNIANLAGVPSVIYGLLGLELFVRLLGLGRSLIAGAATLALLVLPVVITATREALRTVPDSLREGAYALGATRWQVVRQVVLPIALPGVLTGAILSLSRAIGETAPLIIVGAVTFITFLPDGLRAPFTALPIQIFNWIGRPQTGFADDAAAGILVLLATLLIVNAGAIFTRQRLQRRAPR